MERKINYLNNKELLIEIHKSKCTYCFFVKPEYSNFDAIVNSLDEITEEYIDAVFEKKSTQATKKGLPQPDKDKFVFRLLTDEHIPADVNGKKRKLSNGGETDTQRTCFPPFKHYIKENGEFVEVGRSHWTKDGKQFSNDHGRITNNLAYMFMLLTDKISRRGNWRGYSYVDEMRNHALLQLSEIGLKFEESKSDNPFSFYTQVVSNCFTRVLNGEKKNHNIRDDLLIMFGAVPSHTRQIAHELEQRFEEQKKIDHPNAPKEAEIVIPKKRGRKPKAM